MTTILDLSSEKAKYILLKNESYCNFDLPKYFTFEKILNDVEKKLNNNELSGYIDSDKLNLSNNVNYKIIGTKNELWDWRQFELIHPLLYIDLVNTLVKNWDSVVSRFSKFKCENIKCESIPIILTDSHKTQSGEEISNWINNVERESLKLSLKYSFLYITDISNCYASFYTHSIAWAIHGKQYAKKHHETTLLGNKIDKKIRQMSFNETNGIPQGSKIMDFIAEIILGYIDKILELRLKRKKITDYYIIRYRDDYRIFVNNQSDGLDIIKCLSEILLDFGLKLNNLKTSFANDIIEGSLKIDKINSIREPFDIEDIVSLNDYEKVLIKLYCFAKENKNSGQLKTILTKLYKKFNISEKQEKKDIYVLIGLIINLVYTNTSIYSISSAFLSKLLTYLNKDERIEVINNIQKKFNNIPNTGFLDIFLQRISLKIDPSIKYSEKLCNKIINENESIWSSEWINNPSIKNIINKSNIIDRNIIANMDAIITQEEVDAFNIQAPSS